ncbi:hybrid sensor histidine kinase/response regulator [Acidimangrovimonas sediminis]|uniref:hybrid sensor histidine kinase/response regulator n=1 Tax=Acidimangrovimonas sediminis TaxID=2056283 RepID=UPI000C807702|nr:PAS domain-containing hybrid sensor histidine kinase/response regulator [Acidimangrovimonas sediminis]
MPAASSSPASPAAGPGRSRAAIAASRRGVAVTITALAVCFALIVGMAWILLQEIDAISTAKSDNVQWTIAQADVEFLRLRLAIEGAEAGRDTLDELRRDFDVFYSRIQTFAQGQSFELLRAREAFETPRRKVSAFLDGALPLIDGSDAALRAGLPQLARQAEAAAVPVHDLALAGLMAFAEKTDIRRGQVVNKLLVVTGLLLLLVAGLVMLAAAFRRVAGLAEARAREVQASATRMRSIVETSIDAIVLTTRDGTIREFNPAAERIFGYRPEEAIGARAPEILLRDDRARAALASYLRRRDGGAGPRGLIELTAVDRSGRSFPAEVAVDRVTIGEDEVFVAFIRDISHRKAAEENLTDARDRALASERAKADFLAVMSHEMRTPLNGLLGSMQLMRDVEMPPRQSELLGRMQASGQLLLGLVNDVLDLSKYEAGKLEVEHRSFRLTALLDGVVETTAALAGERRNELEWVWVGRRIDAAIGDPRRLKQVLINLVGNALKFTWGGTVTIEVEWLGRKGAEIEFRVIDTGIGIAPEDQDRIFSDFETLDSSYSRQSGGTGLGLGISRRLAHLMGGEIGVESELGEGSLFWLRLPLDHVAEGAVAGTVAGDGGPAGRGVAGPRAPVGPLEVLLVEDNEINRAIAREMLEADGHVVTEAADGRAGVDWARLKRFDVILMDISMPVMDGHEAARQIRLNGGASVDVPIIAVTAHALPEEIARYQAAGMERHVSKPLDREDLRNELAALMPGAPGAGTVPDEGRTAPPEVRLPLIDDARIAALCEILPRPERLRLLDMLVAEADALVARLGEGRDLGDTDLRGDVHHLAGSAGNFGLSALRAELVEIETALKRGQPLDRQRLRRLPALWSDSVTGLRRRCAA